MSWLYPKRNGGIYKALDGGLQCPMRCRERERERKEKNEKSHL